MNHLLKLTFFGAPILTLVEQPLTGLLTGRALALFIYLAVTAAEKRPPHSRDVLADLLWSDVANQQARNNLRYLLPELRQVMADYLQITLKSIGFNRQSAYWLDVEVLQTTLKAQPATIGTPALQAALALYQGEFLAGFTVRNAPVFEAWVTHQREALHQLVMQGLYTLAERYQQADDPHAGLMATQRLLHWEPWHEAGHRLQMQLLAATGQRAAALAQYVLCRKALADELGVAPEAATVALYEQIRTGHFDTVRRVQGNDVYEVANQPVIPAMRHNLPSQLTPFFGRELEIPGLCAQLLAPACRLLTLVGEGGIGKTRLALALAEAVKEHFADGAWFVALADIAPDGNVQEHIVAAIGEALGIRFVGSEHLTKQLFARMREQQLLLIMDNFEHLVEESGFALDLLRAAPGVKILVTSRQRLDFQAEIVWRLDGLALPGAEASRTLREDDFRQVASVALFVERAHRVWPTFPLDATNRRAVTQICQLLEGLPLGIELAAAQLRQHTCAEIAEALQSSYDLLATSLRDVPPRHRTMYAVLAYSWRLLTSEEQHILAACSLFRGGFTREAAVALAQATPALLNSLEDKSLLRLDSSRRFTMHKLVQQFAAEQLSTQADENALLHRHSAYFLDLLASQAELLKFDGSVQALLQRELDNIHRAWQWVTAQGNTALLEKGLTGLIELFRRVGLLQELETMLGRATAAVRGQLTLKTAEKPHVLQALLGRLLVEQAFFCFLIGHSKLAYPLAEEGVQIGEKLKIAAIAAGGYLSLNFLAEWHGDLDAKYKFATAGLAWAQVGQLAALENRCLGSIGMALLYKGEVTSSLPYLQSALSHAQALDAFLECQALGNLSLAHLCLGDFVAAQHYEAQALAISRRMEFVGLSAWAYLLAGERSMRLGQLDQAQSNLNQALAIYTNTGPRVLQCITYQRLSQLFLHRQDYAAALHAANEAVQIAQTYDIQFWHAVVLVSLGRARLGLAHWLEAEAAFNVSLTIAQQTHNSDDMLMARAGLAAVQLAQHNLVSARQQVEGLWSLPSTFYQSPRTDPLFVGLTCYQVLATSGDPRAGERLQTAYRLLMEQAATLEDRALRQTFLENIAIHRELNALAQAAGITAYLDQLPKPLPPVSKNGFGSEPSG